MDSVFPPPFQQLPERYRWKYADAQAKHFGSPISEHLAIYRLPASAIYYVELRRHRSKLFHYPSATSPGAMIRITEVEPLAMRPSPILSRWQGIFVLSMALAFGACLIHGIRTGSAFYIALGLIGLYLVGELMPKALRNLRYGDGTRMARWYAGQAGMTAPFIFPSGLIGSGRETVGLLKRMIDWVDGAGLCLVTEAASPKIAGQYKKFGLRAGTASGLGLFGP